MTSDDLLLSGLLAARRAMGNLNSGLEHWMAGQWEGWLERQSSTGRAAQDRRLIAVAKLTHLEDLGLQVGLMQLMAISDASIALVLTLPTEPMAHLARAEARREKWAPLVHILAESELAEALSCLEPGSHLAAFELPMMLTAQMLESIEVRIFSSSLQSDGFSVGSAFFLGDASGYLDWLGKRKPFDREGIAAALRTVVQLDPKDIALPKNAWGPSGSEAFTAISMADVHPIEGRLDMPGLRNGGELLVTVTGDCFGRRVVVRQLAELREAHEPLRIRMPAQFMTTSPQAIRIESHSPEGRLTFKDLKFQFPPSKLKAWMLSAFLNRGGGGNPVIRAFAKGIDCRIAYAEDEPAELRDIPIVWGVLRQSDRIVSQAKDQGLYFFYIDHAYFNRGHGKTYRITRNRYEAGAVRDCPADRIADLDLDIQPWRKGGREIIICPPTDYFVQAHGCADWLDATLETLRRVTDRPVIIRAKPQPGEEVLPLAEALSTAHALVTHSSNVAIEAVCLGTPVFVSPASAAAPVGLTDLECVESPVYPDRDSWLAHLAYNQFTFEEIGSGQAWQMLLELEDRDLV